MPDLTDVPGIGLGATERHEQWPLTEEIDDSVGDELCIRHLRWTPCFGKHSRYDSGVRECYITTEPWAAVLLRQLHEGKLSKNELKEALATIVNYRVQMSPETVE